MVVVISLLIYIASSQTTQTTVGYIGDICYNSSNCIVQESGCADAQDNSGFKRCSCFAGFYPYGSNRGDKTSYKCGSVIHPGDPRCQLCQGVCVNNGSSVFCQCPLSRTGDNCEIIHLNVSCTTTDMRICYSPHQDVNFQNGWVMFAENYENDPNCKGNVSNGIAWCQQGYEQLEISLNTSNYCGTIVTKDAVSERYSMTIYIDQFNSFGEENTNANPYSFNLYCSFVAFENQVFSGVGVDSSNAGNSGTEVFPNVTLFVVDAYDRLIPAGEILNAGDLVRFIIALVLDGNYGSLEVVRCTASTSPIMPDSTAQTRALMNNGCPVPSDSTANSWYWTVLSFNNNALQLQSGFVPIFNLPGSTSVYLHCELKVCLVGDNSCPLLNQTYCSSQNLMKRSIAEVSIMRHKRDATNVDIQTSLKVQDPISTSSPSASFSTSSDNSAWTVFLTIFIIIAVILIAITAVVALRIKRYQSNCDANQLRPQLFTLPRITRTHERF